MRQCKFGCVQKVSLELEHRLSCAGLGDFAPRRVGAARSRRQMDLPRRAVERIADNRMPE